MDYNNNRAPMNGGLIPPFTPPHHFKYGVPPQWACNSSLTSSMKQLGSAASSWIEWSVSLRYPRAFLLSGHTKLVIIYVEQGTTLELNGVANIPVL